MIAYLTVGIPASGKSTWAESQEGFVNINLDDCRFEICGDATNQTVTKQAVELQQQKIIQAAQKNQNIIISDTNLNPTFRDQLVAKLEALGYEVKLVLFPIDLQEAKLRNKNRSRNVPEEILEKMHNNFPKEISSGLICIQDVLLPYSIINDLKQLQVLQLHNSETLLNNQTILEVEKLIKLSNNNFTPGNKLKEFLSSKGFNRLRLYDYVQEENVEKIYDYLSYDESLVFFDKYVRQLFGMQLVSDEVLDYIILELKSLIPQIRPYFNPNSQKKDDSKVIEIIKEILKKI